MDFIENKKRNVQSSSVTIGKRTYFFDVKATAKGDYYLVITESRHIHDDVYEKQKIFLYKEDFFKFCNAYEDVMAFMKAEKPEYFVEREAFGVEEEDK
ncbi:MAG: DUF3276 family protein [Bacteroidales bacterium]|nr:DUF3276 family protein [Bacteroidales bacterium]